MVERMLMVSFRRHQPVGIGVIELPSLKQNGENVDELIANEFRNEDVVSRIDESRLAIVLQGVNERVMMRRVQDIHRKYGVAAHDGRGAVVEFPADGRSLDDLLRSATTLLSHAREVGGPPVVGADWRVDASAAADILMVDPDETLGAVLAATLQRRGIKVELQPDALYAIDHLTGVAGKPYPRVVILELDLLGIDGLQFLRSIREAGTMDRFRILVLSARSRESDLRQAFELGVDDYVSKPFSTPLLMHRLGRMLDL
ncbi:MAG: response regulator [Acidimicrobiales bacterium]